MEQIKLDSIEDINKVVEEFHKFPTQLRLITARRIHDRLKQLGGFVRVMSNNPILKYPSEHFVIINVQGTNPYDKYRGMVRTDEKEFNFIVYSDISTRLDNINDIHKITSVNCEYNSYADEIYIAEYPESRDFIDLVGMAASKLENFFKYGGSSNDIFRSSLDDIEFIIASNMLTDDHIRRKLLATMVLKDISVSGQILDKALEKRLIAIFNTQIAIARHSGSSYMLYKNFNKSSLEAYLKIQKRMYEETLVESVICSDYELPEYNINLNKDKLINLNDIYKKNNNLTELDRIDLFKLNQNGFSTTDTFKYGDDRICAYVKEGSQFLILKSKKRDDVYYFVNESKKFKVKVGNSRRVDNETMDTVIESTFLPAFNKMNRR